MGHAADAPLVVEHAQAITQTGTTAPVVHPHARGGKGGVGVAAVQFFRHPGETGADREGLHPLAARDGGVHEAQHRSRIRLHRARDVQQQHQAAQAFAGLAPVAAGIGSPPARSDALTVACRSGRRPWRDGE